MIGIVCQYPIAVAYASNCHKLQGHTLDAVVVHCANDFVGDLIYVSSSRIRSSSYVQLLKQPQEVMDMCSMARGTFVRSVLLPTQGNEGTFL